MSLQLNVERYFEAVDELAASVGYDDAPHLYLEAMMKDGASPGAVAAKLRQAFLTPEDWSEHGGLLVTGYFVHPDQATRIAWFALNADVSAAVRRLGLRQRCTKYAASQPLFVAEPALVSAIRDPLGDADMIDEAALNCIGDSEVFSAGRGYAKLDSMLNPRIAAWARKIYPASPRFVRLDPFQHFVEEPPQLLTEAAIVPADPRWLANLSLHGKSFAHYELLDNDEADVWDFWIRRVRRLEVRATRRDDAYLSMMIEELPASDDRSGVMVGRCIHLDTKAAPGTPLAKATLQHLDLAINCYEDAARQRREINTLQYGKCEDASYRTHLYRIEGAPFTALFDLASMFLRSPRLLQQWLGDFHPLRQPPI